MGTTCRGGKRPGLVRLSSGKHGGRISNQTLEQIPTRTVRAEALHAGELVIADVHDRRVRSTLAVAGSSRQERGLKSLTSTAWEVGLSCDEPEDGDAVASGECDTDLPVPLVALYFPLHLAHSSRTIAIVHEAWGDRRVASSMCDAADGPDRQPTSPGRPRTL